MCFPLYLPPQCAAFANSLWGVALGVFLFLQSTSTCLMLAASHGRGDAVHELIKLGADIRSTFPWEGSDPGESHVSF